MLKRTTLLLGLAAHTHTYTRMCAHTHTHAHTHSHTHPHTHTPTPTLTYPHSPPPPTHTHLKCSNCLRLREESHTPSWSLGRIWLQIESPLQRMNLQIKLSSNELIIKFYRCMCGRPVWKSKVFLSRISITLLCLKDRMPELLLRVGLICAL